MAEDIVRVLRVLEYVGPRKRVEEVVSKSIHAARDCGFGLVVSGATIGTYPEILTPGYVIPASEFPPKPE